VRFQLGHTHQFQETFRVPFPVPITHRCPCLLWWTNRPTYRRPMLWRMLWRWMRMWWWLRRLRRTVPTGPAIWRTWGTWRTGTRWTWRIREIRFRAQEARSGCPICGVWSSAVTHSASSTTCAQQKTRFIWQRRIGGSKVQHQPQ